MYIPVTSFNWYLLTMVCRALFICVSTINTTLFPYQHYYLIRKEAEVIYSPFNSNTYNFIIVTSFQLRRKFELLCHFGLCDKSFLNYLNLRILTCPNTHTHTRDGGVCTLHAPVRVRKSRLWMLSRRVNARFISYHRRSNEEGRVEITRSWNYSYQCESILRSSKSVS